MTRVEKYRRYREEISNMKFDSFSVKREATSKFDQSNDNLLDYEKVMDIHEIYNNGEIQFKKKHGFHVRRDQVIYCSIAFAIIASIIVAIVLVGCHLWG